MAAKKKKKNPGNRKFKAALKELGLTVASKRTSKALGVGVRHCQRIASGRVKVPGPIEKLLELYSQYPDAVPQRVNDD